MSFLPFPTRLIAAYFGERDTPRWSPRINGLNLLLIAVLPYALWRYVVSGGTCADVGDEEITVATQHLTPGFAGYVA